MLIPEIFQKVLDKADMKGVTKNLPEFLNTRDKYNECIRNTDTSAKFDEVFLKLLNDDSLTFSDVMNIISSVEKDVILVHNNEEIAAAMPLLDYLIRYFVAQRDPHGTSEEVVEEETCRCKAGLRDNQTSDETKVPVGEKVEKRKKKN